MNKSKSGQGLLLLLISLVMINTAVAQGLSQSRSESAPGDTSIGAIDFRALKIPCLFFAPSSTTGFLMPWQLAPGSANLHFEVVSPALWQFNQQMPLPAGIDQPAWQRDFDKRARGGYSELRIDPNRLLAHFSEKQEWERSSRSFHNDFIPSNLQLKTLNLLWRQPLSTQKDIYAVMDSTVKITAEQLDGQLERMVALGLVERKLISPQNLFTIGLPLRAFQIEMSAKNRNNRVYLYRSRVEKQQILQQLFARTNQIQEDKVDQFGERQRLMEKLKILLFSDTN